MREPDQGTHAWIVKTSVKNYWRVVRWYDINDLIQDGHMHYQRVVQRYDDGSKSRAHIMALFKTVFNNHITDLANKRTRQTESLFCELQADDGSGLEFLDTYIDENSEMAILQGLASKAPADVRAVLRLYLHDRDIKRLRAPYRVRNRVRETFNERLCRLIGVDPETHDVVGGILAYFSDTIMPAVCSYEASTRPTTGDTYVSNDHSKDRVRHGAPHPRPRVEMQKRTRTPLRLANRGGRSGGRGSRPR